MADSMYLMLVETEEDSGLFEVFDYFVLEKDSEPDLRWSKKAKPGSRLMECTGFNNINRNAFFDGEKFIPDPDNPMFNVSQNKEESIAVVLLYEDRVFALMHVHKESPKYIRYEMALDSKTMCLLAPSDIFINLGDIWNGKEFIKAEEI